jgi:hypothetical protein
METVQLQCGSCNKLMAISTQHLGGQVRCPHCQAVVQAPPPPPPPPPQPPPQHAVVTELLLPQPEAREVESIFTPAEPSDDLFESGPQRPLVEMPAEPRPAPASTSSILGDAPPTEPTDNAIATEAPPMNEGAAELARLPRHRPVVDRSYFIFIAMIFLVPYSVLMTLFVIYLWYQLATQGNSLDLLPDPVPKKDGARQVTRAAHDQPLMAHQKVPLGKTVRIGELEVKPLKVVRDSLGDLELHLHAKNVSQNQAFSPIHPDFLKVAPGNKGAMPYTFLDSQNYVRLYGGHLAFQRGGADDKTIEGDLQPGQEEDILLTTKDNKAVVEKIVEAKNENLTWRVQLRRGFVAHRGQKVSTTAVIGVVFNSKEIEKGG